MRFECYTDYTNILRRMQSDEGTASADSLLFSLHYISLAHGLGVDALDFSSLSTQMITN